MPTDLAGTIAVAVSVLGAIATALAYLTLRDRHAQERAAIVSTAQTLERENGSLLRQNAELAAEKARLTNENLVLKGLVSQTAKIDELGGSLRSFLVRMNDADHDRREEHGKMLAAMESMTTTLRAIAAKISA